MGRLVLALLAVSMLALVAWQLLGKEERLTPVELVDGGHAALALTVRPGADPARRRTRTTT